MRVPTLVIDAVYHVGSLDPRDLGRNSGASSLEGRCLSVSLCPDAWTAIARLGGNPVHLLSRPGGEFVDVTAVLADQDTLASVTDWAVVEGLAERKVLWKAWTYDEEDEDWRYSTHASEADGVAELPDGEDAEGPDGPAVEPFEAMVATPSLVGLVGGSASPHDDVTDMLVVAWAMRAVPDVLGREVDGIWWDETYDPPSLSAPRGGVFPERVAGWSSVRCVMPDDDEALSSMPETSWSTGPGPVFR